MRGRVQISKSAGLTFIEVLVVVAILAVLFLIVAIRVQGLSKRSQDIKIRNDVRQLRLLAEQVFDENGAEYMGWSTFPSIANNVEALRNDIDEVNGDAPGAPWESVLIDERVDEYCISAPLLNGADGDYYCADASGRFFEVDSPCVLPALVSTPLECPVI